MSRDRSEFTAAVALARSLEVPTWTQPVRRSAALVTPRDPADTLVLRACGFCVLSLALLAIRHWIA
jgi:hypothetical protein